MLEGKIGLSGTLHITPGSSYYGSDLELDYGAKLTANWATLNTATLEATNASSIKISGAVSAVNSNIMASGGSTIQFGSLVDTSGQSSTGNVTFGSIGVDPNSSIEIGTLGSAVVGAVTIDTSKTLTLGGWRSYVGSAIFGNVVVNGTLSLAAGSVDYIDAFAISDPEQSISYYPLGSEGGPLPWNLSVSGSGTIVIHEGTSLVLGAPDSASIKFAGPNGALYIDAVSGYGPGFDIPTGTISGFTSGDMIYFNSIGSGAQVTNISYTQTSTTAGTLTLKIGGTIVGTLSLSGSYSANGFHLLNEVLNNYGSSASIITYQGASTAPKVITGTSGEDHLYATASNQTLTGGGAPVGSYDSLNGNQYSGIIFKDTAADLAVSQIGFNITDKIDITNVSPTGLTATYNGSDLTVSNITGSLIIPLIFTGFYGNMPAGSFAVVSDGGSGSEISFIASSSDLATGNNQTLTATSSKEVLNGESYSGIKFALSSSDALGNDIVITNFVSSDSIDITGASGISAGVEGSTIYLNNGGTTDPYSGNAGMINLSFLNGPPSIGSFHTASDGASGTLLTWS